MRFWKRHITVSTVLAYIFGVLDGKKIWGSQQELSLFFHFVKLWDTLYMVFVDGPPQVCEGGIPWISGIK